MQDPNNSASKTHSLDLSNDPRRRRSQLAPQAGVGQQPDYEIVNINIAQENDYNDRSDTAKDLVKINPEANQKKPLPQTDKLRYNCNWPNSVTTQNATKISK